MGAVTITGGSSNPPDEPPRANHGCRPLEGSRLSPSQLFTTHHQTLHTTFHSRIRPRTKERSTRTPKTRESQDRGKKSFIR